MILMMVMMMIRLSFDYDDTDDGNGHRNDSYTGAGAALGVGAALGSWFLVTVLGSSCVFCENLLLDVWLEVWRDVQPDAGWMPARCRPDAGCWLDICSGQISGPDMWLDIPWRSEGATSM